MPQKLSLRWLAFLVLLALSLLVFSCSRGVSPAAGPCSGTGVNHYSPRICIDDSNPYLKPTPDPAKAANHLKPKDGKEKVKIEWFAPGKHDLRVTVAPSPDGVPCVESQPACNGGICRATINIAAADDQHPRRRCKYTISVRGDPNFKVNDPVVDVDVCCP